MNKIKSSEIVRAGMCHYAATFAADMKQALETALYYRTIARHVPSAERKAVARVDMRYAAQAWRSARALHAVAVAVAGGGDVGGAR
jgi:hypothetical protein